MLEAFIFGFIGSFHCIGMCGPIAMALPINSNSLLQRISSILIYNFGRVITYAVIGLIFGLIGLGFKLAGFQQTLSIALGCLILLIALAPHLKISRFSPDGLLSKPITFVRKSIAKLFNKNNPGALLTIGLLNGLLPCGFVYLGIIWTTSLGSSVDGMLFMAFFGLGTIPAMLGVSMMSGFISLSFRNKIKKAIPALMVLMGVLLIVRGMDLGIPYLSPHIQNLQTEMPAECH